ncbi:helix-turn-helix domain-containing protein [Pediococcus ethanolidurans]|nr:helix-turn-helix transcriptional regulator [Pediococcus ethanolidurans]GEN94224.1 transcriptional regulator [Pediococcus ethanolidurans]SER15772.1 Helix-turn-helix [Pediococcus ethanolidurans]
MQLNEILRIKRQQMGMTQENLAKKLFVSAQSVSKWELGLSVPTIDNLVTLTDLYNLSLDELIKGSPFFKKPFLVGKKMSWKKIIIFILAWIFISLLLTGFGYQPKWLLVLILLMGIWVFPICCENYWIIDNDFVCYHHYEFKNIKDYLNLWRGGKSEKIYYKDICSVKIKYYVKPRFSPWDINPDTLFLLLKSKKENFILPINYSVSSFLPQFVSFLKRNKVEVHDPQRIEKLIVQHKNLYNYFHSN